MKIPLLLLLLFPLLAVRVSAADINLNPSIITELPLNLGVSPVETNLIRVVTVDQPLDDVMVAMQTWYFSTNYHGPASAVYRTNAVPGVSYTFKIADCAFNGDIGVFWGDMVATQITTNSTKLELISNGPLPPEADKMTAVKRTMSLTLDHVAKLAEGKR
jgi:hypothetical protein